ncbi:hypothetical protein FQA47_013905 [Oryzias melastigma]|uniref:Uncharacterized protein n=1 Tax=Oryzias melastigma TaxID=30732 RepID=A0A834BTC6_ORYME|nr:hypothetical protein FQA47_013905 [Oryzias melastigma]
MAVVNRKKSSQSPKGRREGVIRTFEAASRPVSESAESSPSSGGHLGGMEVPERARAPGNDAIHRRSAD